MHDIPSGSATARERATQLADMLAERFGELFSVDPNLAGLDALVLATFLRAAAAVGLGCCPISAIRDHAATIGDMLRLPHRVVPLAGLCVGWPAESGRITPRLGLDATLHEDRYDDRDVMRKID